MKETKRGKEIRETNRRIDERRFGSNRVALANRRAKDKAAKEYRAKRAEIDALLEKIKAGLDTHAAEANENTWGAVGDLGYYASTLKDMSDALHHEGEYEMLSCSRCFADYRYDEKHRCPALSIRAPRRS